MVNYSFGKIYKIEPRCLHKEEDIYVGSTCQTALCLRFQEHKYAYKYKKTKCQFLLYLISMGWKTVI